MRNGWGVWRMFGLFAVVAFAAAAGSIDGARSAPKASVQFTEFMTIIPKMKPRKPALPARLGKETFMLTYVGKGVLSYRFNITVANHCYARGPVKVTKELFGTGLESSLLEITADIGWQSGICAQAVKPLTFQGRLKTRLSGNVDVIVKMRDRRSGRISTHRQTIRITDR